MSIQLLQSELCLSFEGRPVRFVGTADEPAWVAQDVCDVLGIDSARQALAHFDNEERGVCSVYTVTGKRELLTVYEPGLYKLLMRSRKPEAKKFQKWMAKEVLPSIRKHGVYPPPQNVAFEITLKPYTARVIWVMQVRRRLPDGYWCVFIEGAEILIGAEHIFGPADLEMKQYDLLDGSIGRHWSTFRQDKPWMGAHRFFEYTFPKNDPRGTVMPMCYPMQELEHFKVWLNGEYWTTHFPAYIKRKYGDAKFRRAIPLFAGLGIPLALPAPKKKPK